MSLAGRGAGPHIPYIYPGRFDRPFFTMNVAIALSGGADSLMSLLLLRETGAQVMAVHALFHAAGEPAVPERLQHLCAELQVPLHVLDLRREFEHLVIEPFIRAYQQGLTPNPCAGCNPAMKFGLLLDKARELGADKLATGHYARLDASASGPGLYRGLDPSKDQSYFLSRVPGERFEHVVFPLAGWTKTQVLAELQQRGLNAPAGAESQEICFIPDDYRTFLRSRQVQLGRGGSITLSDGTVLGRHQGLWQHTLGQRKGLGIAWSEPLYVIGKDLTGNRLVVGPKHETLSRGCVTHKPNLLLPPQDWPEQVLVQTIYRQRPHPADVAVTESGMLIRFDEPRPRPTPGQIAAVYGADGQVLAGAEITESDSAA